MKRDKALLQLAVYWDALADKSAKLAKTRTKWWQQRTRSILLSEVGCFRMCAGELRQALERVDLTNEPESGN